MRHASDAPTLSFMATSSDSTPATVGDHAVVLGASLAGLATAVTLSHRFDKVTIVDRDAPPRAGEPRRGVPQGRHAHLLLPAGMRGLAELLPGFVDELRDHGAHVVDAAEFRFHLRGGRLAADDTALAISGATRPLIEGIVRERVRALPGVRIVDGCEVVGLAASADRTLVTGARVRARTGQAEVETAIASLVVDATGRASRSPRWLAELGYAEPQEERLDVGVHYTTRLFRRDPADLGGCRHVVVGIPPGDGRGGLALAVEGGRWLVTLVGSGGTRPPAPLAAFVEYARSLWQQDLHAIVSGAEPLGDASVGAFPAYLRRRYDRLRRFPDRYVVIGDALCSLNPVYAQGMSLAIREAHALGHVLDRHELDGVGFRFLRHAMGDVDDAWLMATGADLADPAVEGARPASWRLINAYFNRLLPVAHRDPVVANAFLEVSSMVARPQRIMRPRIALRVLRGRRRTADPNSEDPAESVHSSCTDAN